MTNTGTNNQGNNIWIWIGIGIAVIASVVAFLIWLFGNISYSDWSRNERESYLIWKDNDASTFDTLVTTTQDGKLSWDRQRIGSEYFLIPFAGSISNEQSFFNNSVREQTTLNFSFSFADTDTNSADYLRSLQNLVNDINIHFDLYFIPYNIQITKTHEYKYPDTPPPAMGSASLNEWIASNIFDRTVNHHIIIDPEKRWANQGGDPIAFEMGLLNPNSERHYTAVYQKFEELRNLNIFAHEFLHKFYDERSHINEPYCVEPDTSNFEYKTFNIFSEHYIACEYALETNQLNTINPNISLPIQDLEEDWLVPIPRNPCACDLDFARVFDFNSIHLTNVSEKQLMNKELREYIVGDDINPEYNLKVKEIKEAFARRYQNVYSKSRMSMTKGQYVDNQYQQLLRLRRRNIINTIKNRVPNFQADDPWDDKNDLQLLIREFKSGMGKPSPISSSQDLDDEKPIKEEETEKPGKIDDKDPIKEEETSKVPQAEKNPLEQIKDLEKEKLKKELEEKLKKEGNQLNKKEK